MANLLSTGINGFLVSARKAAGKISEWFLTGFSGYGWKIWEHMPGRFKFEIDDIVVRNTMTVFELLISKIRSIAGALTISQAHGKIKAINEVSDPDNYLITLEETNSFVAGDFIRMQVFTGGQRSYWVKVSEIRGETVVIPKSEFEGSSLPEVGDEMVQFGNETNTARQAALYLHVDEGGSPAIDLMCGINSKSFTGRVKLRIGGSLPGLPDKYNGLYAENGMLVFTDAQEQVTSKIWPDGTAELGAGSFVARPNKSGYLGGENGLRWYWDTVKNKFICTFGSDAILTWDNLSEDAKENLKGDKGDAPHVGTNGNWWTGGVDTGIKAEGKDGNTPYIGENGNWWINGADTGIKAKGEDGEDANLLSWVEDWEGHKTEIDGDSVVSPKMFSGSKNNQTDKLTGVALGRGVVTIDGVEKTGLFGVKDGVITFSLDSETGDAYFSGKVEARSGEIGGFTITGNGLVNEGFSNDAYIIFRNDARGCFAGMGGNVLPASSGLRAVGRFENNDSTNQWGLDSNYAIIVSARNGNRNVAIAMEGGYISGFGVNTKVISATTLLTRDVNAVFCINSSEITLTLPVCYSYDDGKPVWIKRMGGSKVYVKPGSSAQPLYYDRGSYITSSSSLGIDSEGDAMCFIFVWGLKRTGYSDTGMWVQFKNPRDW